jgi:DNA repair photolyase
MPSKVDDLLAKHNAEVQKIRGFVDLTDEAKARRLSEARAKYQGEFAKAKAAERERVEKKVRQTRKAVYGVPGKATFSDAEKAQINAAYWDARDRVLKVTENLKATGSKEELEKLLDLAERAGDPILAAACYHRGLDLGVQPVVDAYLDFREDEAKRLERYNAALEEQRKVNSVENLLSTALTGKVLGS